ncbi:MAG TPA: histidinol dehydrogenase [Candidatus Pelagibacter bacterium]|nr:histidinol dehydrogenase [Pelagibacteraceae bacterium]HJN83923.1 histidinol dehydrogenase [Candidatus Pelagibacter bacterium]|tara:strand:+ start:8257 stop:9540 length:1284 start_codon:yes stop_codon:yes gene_type:complete
MIKILYCNNKNYVSKLSKLLIKRKNYDKTSKSVVSKIINDVKKHGDKAVLKYEKKYSKNNEIITNKKKISKNIKSLDSKIKRAIDFAYNRIYKFHSKQKVQNILHKDNLLNKLYYKYRPIDSVGIYVPGGNASFPSTVLMNAIPAKIAGVKRIVMINPKLKGKQSLGVLYAAKKVGIKEIYSIGGAQAIAAITYGTKKIKKVNKIFGPGNIFVSAAKKEVFGDVGIDMVAGPSEISVVADKFSNANWVAADLLAQAEHDINSQCILISKDINFINKVKNAIIQQLKDLPRKFIAKKSLELNGILIRAYSNKQIIDIINMIAPEHLELNIKNYNVILNKINNAGSICLGNYSAMAVTDYNAGTNHILPTNSSAKFSSGLSVYDFYKRISYINLSKKGIETLGPSAITLANFEGLEGHAKSVELRIRRK